MIRSALGKDEGGRKPVSIAYPNRRSVSNEAGWIATNKRGERLAMVEPRET
jgi:hypothetical protein